MRFYRILRIAGCVCVAALASATQAQEGKNSQASSAPAATHEEAHYVGTEVCKTCHEEIFNNFEKTPHFKTTLDTHLTHGKQGCEGCHGPGSAHVDGGGDKTKIFVFPKHSAKEINQQCLSCHATDKEQMHFTQSVHAQNDVSCISCHSPHHAATKEFLLVKARPELCYSCHLQQKAQFNMPFHHRVNEGYVECTDCHNPHGTVRAKQVRTPATQDAVCFSCHVDKQGPFVFEHVAVKTEGCQACHTPHGSPNAHLLKVSNVNLLCLQCHTISSFSGAPGTPSFHNQQTFFQACTTCHVQIHGSNFDATFFK